MTDKERILMTIQNREEIKRAVHQPTKVICTALTLKDSIPYSDSLSNTKEEGL